MLSGQTIAGVGVSSIRVDFVNSAQGSAAPATSGLVAPPSNALTPTQILNAYGFNQTTFSGGAVQGNGAGQTIAIVDPYADPDITTDLQTFDTSYNLPINLPGQQPVQGLPTFTLDNLATGSNPPPTNSDWGLEISLDVEWAHALAPDANILLVEANSTSLTDLLTATQTAANTSGVVAVSMSFYNTSGEFPGEKTDDSTYFVTPSGHLGGAATIGGADLAGGVAFVSAAGDGGSPGGYPAYSPNVLSVGGTKLALSGGNYSSETVWNDSYGSTGGGISTVEKEPGYQDAVVPLADSNDAANRAMPDVAFDADPASGVAVVDSYDYGSSTPWVPGTVGGTSFGAPAWAAIVAIADQGRAINGLGSLGSSQLLGEIYGMPSSDLHDVTTGSNGTYSASLGYDLVTGRGTPIVPSVVGYLGQFSVVATTPVAGSTAYSVTAAQYPTSFMVTFSDTPASVVASDFSVNGVAATSVSATSNPAQFTFTFSTSPVIGSQLAQSMTIAAGSITRAVDGSSLLAYSGTFNEDPLPQLTVTSITPTSGATLTAPLTSVTVQFSEAFAVGSISDSNLTLSRGTVTGFTLGNSNTSVTYSLSGLTTAGPGSVIVTIAPGAVTDADGGAGASGSATYYLTTGVIAGLPAGSLIYEASTGGTIATAGAEPQFTLAVAAGETITAIVVPGTLTATTKLSLSGQGVLQTATSSTQNGVEQDAILQNVAIASGGTFTFGVYSPGSGLGTFTLEVYLNAAVSTSSIGGASNNQLSAAQSLTASFESTGPTASRAAVVGVTNGLSNGSLSDYYSLTLAAGQTVTLAATDQSGATGTLGVALLNSNGTTLATGTSMTTNVDSAVENFTATSAGTYYVKVTGTRSNITYALVATVGADFDFDANGTESTAQNISGTAGVLGAITSAAPADWYAVNLNAGASLTLQTFTFGGTTSNSEYLIDSVLPRIQLYNASGTLLASGTGSTNQSLTDSVSTAGTYYVEVTGGSSTVGEYFLETSTALTASITPISPNPTNAAISQMQIVFNAPVSGMSLSALSLTLGSGSNLLTGSQTLTTTDDKTFTLGNLAPLTGTNGVYTLTLAANSGITNQSNLSLQTGASSSFTVDTMPPEVEGVYVSGTAWSPAFLSYLASKGLGSSTLGYLIPGGANQLQDLPWVNITTVSVVFNENVSVNTSDPSLELTGSSGAAVPATVTYSGNTAQWTFASALATNAYQLSIPSTDVTDSLGSTLDGEWTTSSSMYPSGNGVAGGNFSFQFNLLQGDGNQDGQVTTADSTGERNLLLQNTTSGTYSAFYDLVGSGTITGVDGSYVRINSGSTVPAVSPSVADGGSAAAVTTADPSGTGSGAMGGVSSNVDFSDPSAISTAASTAPGQLAFGNVGAERLFIGAPPSGPAGGGSWPTALKVVTKPVTTAPSKAPAHAAASISSFANSVSTIVRTPMIADARPASAAPQPARSFAEPNATLPTNMHALPSVTLPAIDTFVPSVEIHGGGLVGDSDMRIRNDLNGSDGTPVDVWLSDLVLEQELDWLSG